MGSVTSFRGMYNVSAYASSKGGVIQMTKAFSNEFAPHDIQVNCICPGKVSPTSLLFRGHQMQFLIEADTLVPP